jgi:polyisoprenoid-binding protein YceI
MKRHRHLLLAILGASMLGIVPLAHAALSAPSDSHVTFTAAGPAGLKIEGTTPDLTIADQGEKITITVPLANLATGIGLRDKHMKEKYLEVPKFPSAILTVTRSSLKMPTGDKVEADAPSTVTIHWQTKPVSVHYDAKRVGSSISAHGTFHINMHDFGIEVPSYLGVTVKPDVEVSANFKVSDS